MRLSSDLLIFALAVLGCVLALALGVWLGMPGRYQQSSRDIERIMEQGGGRTRRVKRRFTPLAWLQRHVSVGGSRGRRRGFRMESPEDP